MFNLYNYEQIQDKLSDVNTDELYNIICKNIKTIRNERYNEFKKSTKINGINPYSTENFSALLDYNHNHYKRFESENDSTKRIPLEKLVLISLILDVSLDDLIKEK